MFPIHFRFDWLVMAIVLITIMTILFIKSERKIYGLLRIISLCILLWIILEPILVSIPNTAEKPSLAVLVDVSRSMSVQDPRERLGSVKKILEKWNDFMEDHFELSYYQFSQHSSKVTWKELVNAKPYGSITDIYGSIRQVILENKEDHPALLLFSDGTHNLSESFLSDVTLDFPVYTVGVGTSEGIKDIILKDLKVSDFAFKGHPVELAVRIKNFGFARQSLPLTLKEKKDHTFKLVTMKTIEFSDPESEQEVTLKFVPSAPGILEYQLEIPVQKGEIARQNNLLDFSIAVGREKIRVLYLCGQPDPEYAFLRHILKSDPSIELVSFVILRNPENVVPVPEDQLSLIPFPTQEIFVRTLPEFDLLIFENFSYIRFGILTSHLQNIQHFVEDNGGGFLMIGGENSFGLGKYQNTAIEQILPVLINASQESVEEVPVGIKILEPQHPIFDVGESLNETQKLWKNMPLLNGYHKLPGIKSGATLLANFEQSGSPAIVAWQRGKGRVVAMSTLSTWQWALGSVEKSAPQETYIQFWRQLVRWLTSATDSKIVRIILSSSRFTVGQKTLIKVVLQPDKIKAIRDVYVQVTVSSSGKEIQSLPVVAIGKFEYRAEWVPQTEGEFQISATVKDGNKKYEDHRTVKVKAIDWEMENPYPDPSLLQELSKKSGGEYYTASNFSPEALVQKTNVSKSMSVKEIKKPLWNNPWIFSILICLLLIEWALRRYHGQI